ncbi:MAG: ferrochelatase [Rickettsiales bacterium]
MNNKKIAVVLMNLGGPDKLSSVKGFLFNLFNDPNIITLPNPFRWIIAKIISFKREKKAQGIYARMGNSSTILPISKSQAKSLEKELNKEKEQEFKVFVSMRYWHPFAQETIKEIEEFSPEEILLLPLYPQFSTTTTKSSLDEFSTLIKDTSLKNKKLKAVCCYYSDPNFIEAHVELIKNKLNNIEGNYRILFSAHGLPEKIIEKGDPYQWQIEETCNSLVKELNIDNLDYVVCYQSRVGPLKWITPNTEDEIIKAAEENISIIVIPVAFVSDHSETLVELDIEYKELFTQICDKSYIRVESLNLNNNFIKALARQTKLMLNNENSINKDNLIIFSEKKCTRNFNNCFCKI